MTEHNMKRAALERSNEWTSGRQHSAAPLCIRGKKPHAVSVVYQLRYRTHMIVSCSRAAALTAYQFEFRRFRSIHRAGRFVSNQSQASTVFELVYSRPDIN